jgi:hypothetical protein
MVLQNSEPAVNIKHKQALKKIWQKHRYLEKQNMKVINNCHRGGAN